MSEAIIAEILKQGVLGIGLVVFGGAIAFLYRSQEERHKGSHAEFEAERTFYRGLIREDREVFQDKLNEMAHTLERVCETLDRIDRRNGGR